MTRSRSFPLAVTSLISLLFAFAYSCNTPSGTVAGLSLDTLKQADALMQSYVDDGKLPCVSILILKDGKQADKALYGYENIEEQRPLKEDAIFRIYSMSKPITTAALMMLYDEGKFKLDDPVATYIPEFEDTKVWEDGKEVEQIEPFTIRHLLTHTAGFCYGWDVSHVDSLYAQASIGGFLGKGTLEDAVRVLATLPLKNPLPLKNTLPL